MVMPWLGYPNPRPREDEAGATKAKEGTGPVTCTALEARTAPKAEMAPEARMVVEDEVEDDTVDAVLHVAAVQ